jgi:uncharacterized coiled-coil DUF342 family protein
MSERSEEIHKLCQEIANLRAERDKFGNDAICHRVKVEELKDEIAALKAENEELKRRLANES